MSLRLSTVPSAVYLIKIYLRIFCFNAAFFTKYNFINRIDFDIDLTWACSYTQHHINTTFRSIPVVLYRRRNVCRRKQIFSGMLVNVVFYVCDKGKVIINIAGSIL
jgi:hypothetical protein